MDNRLQDIVENLDKYLIGIDDPFKFKCLSCGKCCKNREDILFTARDVFRIAQYLGKKPYEIIQQYCDCYVGTDSRMPIVRLKPVGSNKACPFLRDKRCAIHAVKPVVCALYPVGRMVQIPIEGTGETAKITASYILQPTDCGSHTRTNTVRQWLERFNIPVDDEFYSEWNELITEISGIIRDADQKFTKASIDPLYDVLGGLLYTRYDTAEAFMPQFMANKKDAIAITKSVFVEFNRPMINQRGAENG